MPVLYDAEHPLVLCLPMPANLGNARMHWTHRLRVKKDYFRLLDTMATIHGKIGPSPDLPFLIPGVPQEPLGPVLVTTHMTLGNVMDDDNAVARMKFALDWMVRRGYVKDDNRKWLRHTGYPTQNITRKEAASLRFTVTPVPSFKS